MPVCAMHEGDRAAQVVMREKSILFMRLLFFCGWSFYLIGRRAFLQDVLLLQQDG